MVNSYILRIYSFSKLETTEIFTNFFTLIFISWLLFRLLLHVTLCNSFQWRIMSVSCDLSTPNQGTELLSLRLAVSGSIVDPWVYILLRKETLSYIHKMMRRCQRNYDVNLQSSTSLDMNSMWLRVYMYYIKVCFYDLSETKCWLSIIRSGAEWITNPWLRLASVVAVGRRGS